MMLTFALSIYSYRADVNLQGKDGNSPLHLACNMGNATVFNSLVSLFNQDIKIDSQNCTGQSVLHLKETNPSSNKINVQL